MQRSRLRLTRATDPMSLSLAVVLFAALVLRLFGLNWDQGQSLHPDERFIIDYVMIGRIHLEWPLPFSELLDPSVSGLNPRSDDPETGNPRSFAYGTLPLFVTEVAAEAMTRLTGEDWHWRDRVYLIGRAFSALLDTGTVLLTFLLARKLASRRVALLAALVAACAPLSIQLAHFFTTDSWLTFFVALCLLWSAEAAMTGSRRWYAAAGFALGLALATKGSVFALSAVLAVALMIDATRRRRQGATMMGSFLVIPERLALAAIAASVAFAIFEPYALVRPTVFWSSFQEQADIHRGYIDVPFTRQYVGTLPVVYHAEQLVRWGFGPVAGILSLVGILALLFRLAKRGAATALILLTWLAAYAVVIFLPESKFIRYLAPLAPVLAITAGLALDTIWRAVSRFAGRLSGVVVGTGLITGITLWALAFSSIYAGEQPRIAASSWIYANVPSGSVLSGFIWDDALPLPLAPGLDLADRQYEIAPIDIYETGPTLYDLDLIGKALGEDRATTEIGQELQSGDYAAAAIILRSSAPAVDDPGGLAGALSSIVDDYSQVAGDLPLATATLANELVASGGRPPESVWFALADAIQRTGDAQTSTLLFQQLQTIDYVVLSSNRVPVGITNLPWRYPVQIRFLETLNTGELGFDLVYEATNYPRLGPVAFPDDSADEAWLNYDHPHVWIYQKQQLPEKAAFDAVFASANAQPVSPTRYQPEEPLMLDQAVDTLPVVADARWSAALTSNSAVAFAVWVILLLVLQVIGWPVASLIFGRFADGGWGFARLLTLLISGWIVWIAASLEFISFRAIWCGVALAVVGLLGWFARLKWRGGRTLWRSRGGRPETAIWAEVVFWGVFALFLTFRLINPDGWHPIWGGEKPMEFAHLNAILRSAHFPPYDPWFGGGYINYYYYGMYLVAFLFKLTGIPSEVAFNLAQPTVISLLASGTFSLVSTLGRDLAKRRAAAIPAGLVGVLLTLGIGNLTAFAGYLDAPVNGISNAFDYYTWSGSRAIPDVITEFPYFTALYADLHAHVVALPITMLLIGLAYAVAADGRRFVSTIRRLPAVRFVDALPVVVRLGLAAVAIGSLGATNAWDVPPYLALTAVGIYMVLREMPSLWARLATTAAVSGIVALAALLLFLPFFTHYVAIFGSLGRVKEPTDFAAFFSHFGALLTIVALGLIAVSLAVSRIRGPVWMNPLLLLALVAGLLAARGFASPGSVLQPLFEDTAVLLTGGVLLLASLVALRGGSAVEKGVVGLGGFLLLSSLWVDQVVLGMMIAFLVVGALLWWRGNTSSVRFISLLVSAAAAIVGGTEILFLADDLVGGSAYRMNTVFKFYNQVWILLSVAGAGFLTWMGAVILRPESAGSALTGAPVGIVSQRVVPSPATSTHSMTVRQRVFPLNRTAWSWAQMGLIVGVLVIVASLFYPALATGPRLAQSFDGRPGPGTLNALDWMSYGSLTVPGPNGPQEIAFADDLAAIAWFNEEVEGSPVIAEASIGPYRGNGSRFSIATGLPAVIGWSRHEYQQRYPEGIVEREREIRTLYDAESVEEKLRILNDYGVTYLVVGDLERLWTFDGEPYASAAGIATFDDMVGSSLEVAFHQGSTTVYRVIPEARP